MATVNLPETVTVRAQKALREAGLAEFSLNTAKLSEAALLDLITAGAYTRHTAGTTHLTDKAKKAGKTLGLPDWQAYTDAFIAKYEAPEFIARQRAEGGEDELTLEEKALVMALEPRFAKAGVIWRANAKAGKTAKTVLDVIDELGGDGDDAYEVAARAVGGDYLAKQKMDANLIPAALDGSWKAIQADAKDHLKSLKLKAGQNKAASAF